MTAKPPLLSDTAFHCQQATEKAMKALLAWHDVPFRRVHSLEEIGEQVLADRAGSARGGGSSRTTHRVRMEIPVSG
ncbi:MAG: HEPN domain-containing protein [Chloroflexota bacterium]